MTDDYAMHAPLFQVWRTHCSAQPTRWKAVPDQEQKHAVYDLRKETALTTKVLEAVASKLGLPNGTLRLYAVRVQSGHSIRD